jgi:hypothetical protein
LAQRLDRQDVLLLKEFYHTGRPYPNDTTAHVLCLLVDRLRRGTGPLAGLSYWAIRRRLENLVALGLLERIRHTNPAVYMPVDPAAPDVERAVLPAVDLDPDPRPSGRAGLASHPTGNGRLARAWRTVQPRIDRSLSLKDRP